MNLISFRWCTIWIAFICPTYQASDVQCGTVRDVRLPLILGGNQTIRGQWPFVVALHKGEVFEYICGGTLISTKHVLTGKDLLFLLLSTICSRVLTKLKRQLPIVSKESIRYLN